MEEFIKKVKQLVFHARTTGGTAGPDEGLKAALDAVEADLTAEVTPDLDHQLKLADAQFLGFVHAKSGYSLTSLAENMGLTADEWKLLRDTVHLSPEQKAEIDLLF